MPHVKVDRIQLVSQMQLGIVVEAAAAEPFVPAGDPPAYEVAEGVMVQVQIERDRVVEAEILGVNRIALQDARTEGDDFPVLAPDKETNLVAYSAAETTKIRLGQPFEVQLRSMVDLQIERVDLIDDRRDIADDAHLDRLPIFGSPKFFPQFPACAAAERASHVFVEA